MAADESSTRRRRADGAWEYGDDDYLFALKVGQWGLDLSKLDDMIELARQAGIDRSVKFLEGERARICALAARDGSGLAARDAARVMAGLLREAKLLPAAERWAEIEPKLPAPGEQKTIYTPKRPPSRVERDKAIAAAKASGATYAQLEKTYNLSRRQLIRIVREQRDPG